MPDPASCYDRVYKTGPSLLIRGLQEPQEGFINLHASAGAMSYIAVFLACDLKGKGSYLTLSTTLYKTAEAAQTIKDDREKIYLVWSPTFLKKETSCKEIV